MGARLRAWKTMEFVVFVLAAPWLAAIAATAAAWVGDAIVGRQPPQGADITYRLGGGFDLLMWVAVVLMKAGIASQALAIPAIWLAWFGFPVRGLESFVDSALMTGGPILYACVAGLVVIGAVVTGLQAVDEWRRRHRAVVPAVGGNSSVSEDRDEANPFVAPRCK